MVLKQKQKLNICYYKDEIEEIEYYFLINVKQDLIDSLSFIRFWSDVKRFLKEKHVIIEIDTDNKN